MPASGKPHRTDLFYFLFSIPFGLVIMGVEMTSNYIIVRWAFAIACLSFCVMLYLSLVVLTARARTIWTVAVTIVCAAILVAAYRLLCPTVTITPAKVMYALPDPNYPLSQSFNFRVQNRVNQDVYGVVFLIRVHSRRLGLRDFKFDIPDSSRIPLDESVPEAQKLKLADMDLLECTDTNGYAVFEGGISHLQPQGSREIKVTLLNPYAEDVLPSGTPPPRLSVPKGEIEVTGRVTGVTDNSEILSRPGMSVTPAFVSPETLKCSSIWFFTMK